MSELPATTQPDELHSTTEQEICCYRWNGVAGSVNHQANVSGNSGCIRRRLRVAKLRSAGRPVESERTVDGCAWVDGFSAPAVHCYGGMMSDLVSTAADALLPFLATGGAAIGTGMADQAGSDLYNSALRVIKKIKERLRGYGKADVEAAIREALADGSLSKGELQQLRAHSLAQNNASGTTVVGSVEADTSFVGNTNIGELNIGRRE